jgi:hypothetical protein
MLKRFRLWSFFLVGLLSLGVVLAACGDTTATPAPAASVSQGLSLRSAPTQVATGVKSGLAQNFPQDTSIFVSLNTATSSDQVKDWQKLVDYLSNIPELKDAFQKLDLLKQANFGSYDTDIKPWIGDELALGVTNVAALANLTSGKMPSGEIPVLIAAQVKDKGQLETFITNLLTKLKFNATTETYNGATLRNINLLVVNLTLGYTDTKFFLGGSPALVKAAIDRTEDKSLTKNSQYSDIAAKLPTGYLGFAYADVQNVVKTLSSTPEAQTALNGVNMSSLGLDYLGGMGITMGTATEGFRVDSYQTYLTDKEPADIKARLNKGANPSEILKVLPEKTFAFANGQDGKGAYDLFIKQVGALGDQGKKITDAIAKFESDTGLNVQNDIAALFPDEFAVFAQPASGYTLGDKNSLPVGIGLLTKVSDQKVAQANLDKIAAAVEKANSNGQWKFQPKTYKGVDYKQAANPNGGNSSLSIGVAGNYAFVSSSPEQTEALINSVTTNTGTFLGSTAATNFNNVKTVLTQDSRGYAYLDIQQAIQTGLVTLPADQQTKTKGYTDKLTEFKAAGFSTSENDKGSISTFYLYYPGIK